MEISLGGNGGNMPWLVLATITCTYIELSTVCFRPSPDFSPWLQDKIWEWPGDEARGLHHQRMSMFTIHNPQLLYLHEMSNGVIKVSSKKKNWLAIYRWIYCNH